jgi:hypothetical protein
MTMRNKKKSGLFKSLFLIGAITFSGCAQQRGVFEDYPVEYHPKHGWQSRTLTIYSKEKGYGRIVFRDDDNDGRFDEILLTGVRNGDSVEEYANLKSGQEIASGFLSEE